MVLPSKGSQDDATYSVSPLTSGRRDKILVDLWPMAGRQQSVGTRENENLHADGMLVGNASSRQVTAAQLRRSSVLVLDRSSKDGCEPANTKASSAT